MPRNGSGVYAGTAGVPVTSGTTISSTVFNNLITDIGNEITGSLPVAGTAPMTGALRATLGSASAPGYTFTGDTNTGIYSAGADTLNFTTAGTLALTVSSTQTTTWAGKAVGKAFDADAITSVASAATTDIGAAATSEVLITGTTGITSFGTSNAGIRRRGRFAAALSITHNATSLILPGGVSITTAANDSFEALSLGSGNWIVTDYRRAAGSWIAQRVGNQTGAVATGSTVLPGDDTIPQNTEGDQYLSQAITPISAASTLVIDIVVNISHTAIGTLTAALFQDSTAGALACSALYSGDTGALKQVVFRHTMTSGTTSSTTFKVLCGGSSAGTMTFNGVSGGRIFGGVFASSITITEYLG